MKTMNITRATRAQTTNTARRNRRAKQKRRFRLPAITPRGLEASISRTLPMEVHRIARELHPEKIVLFGSYAYGKPSPDSDVDLLVVMNTDASSAERSWSVSCLLIPRPFPVDILVKTPAEISRAVEKGDYFIQEILTQGKVLYERS